MRLFCKRIIDAGKAPYCGRTMVVLFIEGNHMYHWVTSSNTKGFQKLKEGYTYNIQCQEHSDGSLSYVKVIDD